jgi:hypothetical protein
LIGEHEEREEMADENERGENEQDPGAVLTFEGEGRLIRRQWHNGVWYFSVVDVVGLLTDSADPGNYWSQVKRRMQGGGADKDIPDGQWGRWWRG